MVTDWAREIAPNITHVTADQGVTQKTKTFAIPARKDRLGGRCFLLGGAAVSG